MNDEVVIMLGELSTSLLADPRFKALNDLFEQQVAADVLETKPEEKQKREYLYATLQGGRAFMSHLQLFAEKHKQLTSSQPEESTTQDYDEFDNPDVHDF